MKSNALFYKLRDGKYICNGDLENAFYYTHGYKHYLNEVEYSRWLYSLLGVSIIEVVKEYDMDVVTLDKTNRVQAVKLYRDRYGCTVKEAYDFIRGSERF